MVTILASNYLGEVEVGSVDCAGGYRLQTFCGFLIWLASAIHTIFFHVSGCEGVWIVQVCTAL